MEPNPDCTLAGAGRGTCIPHGYSERVSQGRHRHWGFRSRQRFHGSEPRVGIGPDHGSLTCRSPWMAAIVSVFLKTESHCIARAGFELVAVFLSQFPKC